VNFPEKFISLQVNFAKNTMKKIILFVAGEKSSIGKVLLNECRKANVNTYLISSPDDIDVRWLENIESVGICGATSTPKWLMEDVAGRVNLLNKCVDR
jgi:4-hydroxy-3-methylbut-2-enyl diphosphate reductase